MASDSDRYSRLQKAVQAPYDDTIEWGSEPLGVVLAERAKILPQIKNAITTDFACYPAEQNGVKYISSKYEYKERCYEWIYVNDQTYIQLCNLNYVDDKTYIQLPKLNFTWKEVGPEFSVVTKCVGGNSRTYICPEFHIVEDGYESVVGGITISSNDIKDSREESNPFWREIVHSQLREEWQDYWLARLHMVLCALHRAKAKIVFEREKFEISLRSQDIAKLVCDFSRCIQREYSEEERNFIMDIVLAGGAPKCILRDLLMDGFVHSQKVQGNVQQSSDQRFYWLLAGAGVLLAGMIWFVARTEGAPKTTMKENDLVTLDGLKKDDDNLSVQENPAELIPVDRSHKGSPEVQVRFVARTEEVPKTTMKENDLVTLSELKQDDNNLSIQENPAELIPVDRSHKGLLDA